MDVSDTNNKNGSIQQNESACINETIISIINNNDTSSTQPHTQSQNVVQPIEEMLGSVTTYNNMEGPAASGTAKNCQQVRSSARVFKKLKLENAQALMIITSDKDKKDAIVNDKIEIKKPFRPQWSSEDKDIFFEALNEYGKDFDAIQQHINNRFKKKSLPETVFKTKDQCRHFYTRTWHKISKHLKFSEDIKKVAQELYALINFGELRKKVGPVTEKTCLKLNELIYRGSVAIRIKGKTIRIKTPMCRALRKLNQLDEKHEDLKLPTRVLVELRPKNMETWLNVQFMSQNPRVRLSLPLQRRLSAILTYVNERWKTFLTRTHEKAHNYTNNISNENGSNGSGGVAATCLNPQLRLAPKTNCSVEVPTINLSEYLTSHRICLNAYEERVGVKVPGEQIWQNMYTNSKGTGKAATKNRGIKRQRNDSSAGEKILKQKENCDEHDCDNNNLITTTVSAVVDSAINTILSLQKQELEKGTDSQEDDIKIESDKEKENTDGTTYTPCKTEEISKIKNGWTLEDCGTLTIGELYLMFGHDSKLELEYCWDSPVEIKNENTSNNNNIEVKQELSSSSSSSSSSTSSSSFSLIDTDVKKPNELTVTLKKLLSLARLHYRKERIKCPCGHVCGGTTKANSTNRAKSLAQKNSNLRATLAGDEKNTTNESLATLNRNSNTSNNSSSSSSNNNNNNSNNNNNNNAQTPLNCMRNVTVNSESIFRKPTIYPSNDSGTDSFRAQLDSFQRMPKCTNRKGRPVRNKHVVVERMLPLLPKPLINGHSIVTMKVISTSDKLRPIAPRIDENNSNAVTTITTTTSTTNSDDSTLNLETLVSTAIAVDTVNLNNNNNNNNNNIVTVPLVSTTSGFFLSSNNNNNNNNNIDECNGNGDEDNEHQQERITSPTSISNFLDLEIPTADTNDLILANQVKDNNLTSFAGLLSSDLPDTSTPLSSPSRILKENDNQWLNSEVNDYSLTSLLGHLESPMKSTTPAVIIPCDDAPISQDIDSQFPSLLGENGVDFVDQFVDMAAQVETAVNGDIEQLTNT